MKRLSVIFALSLAFFVQAASAESLLDCVNYKVSPLLAPGRLTLSLSGLYWQASSTELNHFISNGEHWAGRGEITYHFACTDNDLRLAVTDFNETTSDSAFGNILNNNILLSPFLSVPASIGNIEVDGSFTDPVIQPGPMPFVFTIPGAELGSIPIATRKVAVSQNLKNRTWDLDVGKNISIGRRLQFHFFTGLRYSQLEHTLTTTTFATGITTVARPLVLQGISPEPAPTFTTIILFGESTISFRADVQDTSTQKSKYNGFGPRMGLDSSLHLISNLNLISNITTSMLIGESKNFYRETRVDNSFASLEDISLVVNFPGFTTQSPFDITSLSSTSFNNSTSQEISFHLPNETRVVPNVDAKLGLEYCLRLSNFSTITVESGYEISYYFNAFNQFDVSINQITPNLFDTSFRGPYLKVSLSI